MNPASVEYVRPASLSEALELLDQNTDTRVLAGGTTLVGTMKARSSPVRRVVDIGRIGELDFIRQSPQGVILGSTTRLRELVRSELLQRRWSMIHEAASSIGDPLVRNMGTLGGNLCAGSTANDLPACMIAGNARFVFQSRSGMRPVTAREFYGEGPERGASPREVLVSVELSRTNDGQGSAYVKWPPRALGPASAGVAVSISVGAEGRIVDAGVGFAHVPWSEAHSEAGGTLLRGRTGTENDWRAASRAATRELSLPSDYRSSERFRREVLEEVTCRALATAWSRAQGGGS